VDGAGLTNELTLGKGWQIGSRDLERAALQQGFWAEPGRLDFKSAYAIETWPKFLTERRKEASRRCLEGPPLALNDLKSWLRDHGDLDGPPSASREFQDPDRYSVCMHSDPMSMTTASLVAELPEETTEKPWPVWISFATPCTGIFVPVYLEGVIPAAFASAGDSPSGVGGTEASVWCAMRALQERATTDFESALPIIRAGWRELEDTIEVERVRVEEEVSNLYAREAFDEGRRMLSEFMATQAEAMLETARRLMASL
jgi:hypothetical protein